MPTSSHYPEPLRTPPSAGQQFPQFQQQPVSPETARYQAIAMRQAASQSTVPLYGYLALGVLLMPLSIVMLVDGLGFMSLGPIAVGGFMIYNFTRMKKTVEAQRGMFIEMAKEVERRSQEQA